jgi:MFS family permease
MQKRKSIFYGWYIVFVSLICVSTGTSTFLFSSLGLFFQPFNNEFGWDRAQISSLIPFLIISLAVTQPIAGRIIDKIGTLKLLIPSTIAFGILLAAIPTFVSKLWHLGFIFFLFGTLGFAANTMSFLRIVSSWFNKKRGLAIGLSISGIGLGYAYVPLLVQYVIDAQGWRAAYYVLSLIVLFITVPLIYFVFKEYPEDIGLSPDGANDTESIPAPLGVIGLTSSEALRKREFWLLTFIFVFIAFSLHGILPHLFPLLTDKGLDNSTAAIITSIMGITVMISRVLIGFLLDIYFAPRVAFIFFALSGIGFGILSLSTTIPFLLLGAILVGFSLGAEIDILAYMIGKYFGLRSFAEIYGLLFVGVFFGTAMGPYAFGLGFESTGSYSTVLIIAIILNLAALVLTRKLGPYTNFDEPSK